MNGTLGQSEWRVYATAGLVPEVNFFFSESSFILPERFLFLSLSKVMLLLFLCINQDLREKEEEICGRTSNASPPSPRSQLTKLLSSSVF